MLNPRIRTLREFVNYNDLTIPEIKKELDKRGIKYSSNERKDSLIKKLGE